MATLFHLVRHGSNDLLGHRLAGRLPEVHLNAEGLRQAELTASHLAASGVRQIISSPLARAKQTARPLAERLGLPVEIWEEFTEVDFGSWQGAAMADLAADPKWREFQDHPALWRHPGGESILELQTRVLGGLEKLRREREPNSIALFSHGDVIKVALAWHLGMPLDFFPRLHLSPASVSVVEVSEGESRILGINQCPHPGPWRIPAPWPPPARPPQNGPSCQGL